MKKIKAKCSVDGHLRYGHYSLVLSDEEYAEYDALSESEKEEYIAENGEFALDGYEVYDRDIYDIQVKDF